ncbi:hypothetical protein BGZ50_006168 [Haplosporangium sp. Z 11]|nr:hypothetical protein BGZ50_006168 [Haplosporangium sp. Z 11]
MKTVHFLWAIFLVVLSLASSVHALPVAEPYEVEAAAAVTEPIASGDIETRGLGDGGLMIPTDTTIDETNNSGNKKVNCGYQATTNAFSVKVPSSDTVNDLKEPIKNKKLVDFEHVDANNLTLWHVAHPIIAANKHQSALLNAIDSLTELDPTDDIADVFTETPPKKTIHVIIRRPSSVHALALLEP